MTAPSIPAPLEWRANRAKTDIFSAIIRASKQFGGKTVAIVDGDGTEVDYKTVLRGSFALGSALGKKFKKDETVGVMLPTGAGAVIAFCAVLASGRLPAMLNFTAGSANIKSAMKAGKITKIVTAHKFVELGGLESLIEELSDVAEFIYLEDVRESLGFMDKVAGGLGPIIARRVIPSPALCFSHPARKANPKALSYRITISSPMSNRFARILVWIQIVIASSIPYPPSIVLA